MRTRTARTEPGDPHRGVGRRTSGRDAGVLSPISTLKGRYPGLFSGDGAPVVCTPLRLLRETAWYYRRREYRIDVSRRAARGPRKADPRRHVNRRYRYRLSHQLSHLRGIQCRIVLATLW